MKFSAMRAGPRFLPAVVAGVTALAIIGCGEEPRPKPKLAAKAAPPPAAPLPAETMKDPAPVKPAAGNSLAADQALADRVKSALVAEPGLNAHGIDVVAKDGAVTLFGTTETKARRETAARIATAVAGVKSVENKLAVVAGS